jgi:hypothetical protein
MRNAAAWKRAAAFLGAGGQREPKMARCMTSVMS